MWIQGLFGRRRRCYAQIARQGIVISLWELEKPPVGGSWNEVEDMDPRWIGHPLPASARVIRHPRQSGWRLLPG